MDKGSNSEMEIPQPRRCVYAGTFDPPTNGHLWMIERGVLLFDELEVSIGVNPLKNTQFSLTERMEMLEAITGNYSNVKVGQFEDHYLVTYAKGRGFNFMLRGLRSTPDFDYEQSMNSVNQKIKEKLQANVQEVYLICPPDLAATSSSLVKGLVGPEGWEELVAEYVPGFVLEALKKHHRRTSSA